ncbi:monovalent cation/H(+) antiporter subunit G [Streptomyces verrucosisporus]|uniref:monovalent cation/H(+) antiporter subunit G n=1 Tax=Streptomyces verrucosisporus TaxID=1695161 RepID=UPI0019CF5A6F|nr:monovalent cation/H(+) antiporter subunit G [Streptomyces verrucosisporus]MBN3929747.1 monovalent cation/H(+) antiporter subunit G [Streptomyces verrucosisporus]
MTRLAAGAGEVVLATASAVLLLTGALFCLLGALGLLRFPDTASRLHASSKAQTLGVLLSLLGAALRVPPPYAGLLLLVALFQLFTVPVAGQVIGRVAYRTGAVDRSTLVMDELAGRLGPPDPEAAAEPGDTGSGDGAEDEPEDGAGDGRRREV